MTLQAEYLDHRESVALYQELFKAVYDMALIQIDGLLAKRMRPRHLCHFDVIAMAEDSALEIMERYRNPGWRVKTNYGKAVYSACLERMYGARHREHIDDGGIDHIAKDDIFIDQVLDAEMLEEMNTRSVDLGRISRRAKTASSYQAYLRSICIRHSLDWISDNLDKLRRIWDMEHA
jgi:hypothetical protein